MNTNRSSFVFLVGAVLILAYSTFAQDQSFSDPNVDYTFSLPDAKWKMTVKPSATSPNVEYVYGERSEGHLEVRKLTVGKDDILTDIVQDEEQKLQFRPGFVAGREENFAGRIKGAIYNFEYVAAGQNMSGRFYFLRGNDTTVYVLRFAGKKDNLKAIRNQTDSIARSFGVKP